MSDTPTAGQRAEVKSRARGCNRIKATRTTAVDPDSGRIFPLFHPRQQEWNEHFAWSPDYRLIIGLTATGRATVMALHLNRFGVVNLRRALLVMGEHPPLDSEETSL